MLAELAAALGSDSDSASWILTAMFVSSAVSTPIAGRAADLYGGRRVLLVTTALITLGSVICAVADVMAMMAVGRAMTDAGVGAIPVGIGLMRVVVGSAALRMGTAAMSMTVGAGGALALPVSALLTRCGGPQLIFWGAVGVLPMVSMIACSRQLQEFAVEGGIGLSALAAALLPTPGGIAMLAAPPPKSRLCGSCVPSCYPRRVR